MGVRIRKTKIRNCAVCGNPVWHDRPANCCVVHAHGTLTMEEALKCLPEKYQSIVKFRKEGLNLRETGEKVGLSVARVGQIEKTAKRFFDRMLRAGA